MVRSTTGKAGGYVKFPRTAVLPGNIATPVVTVHGPSAKFRVPANLTKKFTGFDEKRNLFLFAEGV